MGSNEPSKCVANEDTFNRPDNVRLLASSKLLANPYRCLSSVSFRGVFNSVKIDVENSVSRNKRLVPGCLYVA